MITQALLSLRPNCNFSMANEDYSTLVYQDENLPKPTLKQLQAEVKRLEKVAKSQEYIKLRQKEYPDILEYIDGVVKGDQDQINSYIQKCAEVKAKYPKPKD